MGAQTNQVSSHQRPAAGGRRQIVSLSEIQCVRKNAVVIRTARLVRVHYRLTLCLIPKYIFIFFFGGPGLCRPFTSFPPYTIFDVNRSYVPRRQHQYYALPRQVRDARPPPFPCVIPSRPIPFRVGRRFKGHR